MLLFSSSIENRNRSIKLQPHFAAVAYHNTLDLAITSKFRMLWIRWRKKTRRLLSTAFFVAIILYLLFPITNNALFVLMKLTTAVIIDDIEDARKILDSDLKTLGLAINIIGEASGVVEGVKLVNRLKPQLVFLDIEMPDGDGFDLLEMVQHKKFKTIFTTASDAHALKAFKFSAIDYLLKPINQSDLKEAVMKAVGTVDHPTNLKALSENIANPIHKMERLVLNTQEKMCVVKISDIIRCESDVNYTKFFLKSSETILVTKTLKEYDAMLADSNFIRVHQSHLVNLDFIKEFVKADGGHINLTSGGYIPVSTRRKTAVMQALEQI
ncbi:MAG: two-component system LytT family response regulator [Bacteroidia bacterium]|jgi:two-component system LytT family response regulator